MPAYFSVEFQFEKTNVKPDSVRAFYEQLLQCGFSFLCGCCEATCETAEEIGNWNQRKLSTHFGLAFAEDTFDDYKQMEFRFHDFSHVRWFVFHINEGDTYSFVVVIPEDDFIEYQSGTVVRQEYRMQRIEEFIIHMWQIGSMCCIQTGWEGSDCVAAYSDIRNGSAPNVEPYAIVPKKLYRTTWDCDCESIGRDGVLLKNHENWNY